MAAGTKKNGVTPEKPKRQVLRGLGLFSCCSLWRGKGFRRMPHGYQGFFWPSYRGSCFHVSRLDSGHCIIYLEHKLDHRKKWGFFKWYKPILNCLNLFDGVSLFWSFLALHTQYENRSRRLTKRNRSSAPIPGRPGQVGWSELLRCQWINYWVSGPEYIYINK